MLRSFIVLIVLSSPLVAAPPPREQIDEWVRDLDSPKFRLREAAAKHLSNAGAESAIALGQAARRGNAEVSGRALKLLGDMVDGEDAKAELAARKQLRRLVEAETGVAGEAKMILHRKRDRMLAVLQLAGADPDFTDEGMIGLSLDTVADLESILPLLKHFPELERLSISNKRFTDAGAKYLAELPNLQRLNLYQSNIGDEGVKSLKRLKNLRMLPIGETRITDNGLKSLGEMTQLEYLGVRGNHVTDAGLAHLKDLTNLTDIYLGQTKITDEGLKLLAPMTKLKTIYLHTTGITDAGLEHLAGFKNLRDIYLARTKTTETGQARLKEALPYLTIDTTFPNAKQ